MAEPIAREHEHEQEKADPWDVADKVTKGVKGGVTVSPYLNAVPESVAEHLEGGIISPLELIFGIRDMHDGFEEGDLGKAASGTKDTAVGGYGLAKWLKSLALGGEEAAEGAEVATEAAEGTSMAALGGTTVESVPIIGPMIAALTAGWQIGKWGAPIVSESMRGQAGGHNADEVAWDMAGTLDEGVSRGMGPTAGRVAGAEMNAIGKLNMLTGLDMGAGAAWGRTMKAREEAEDRHRMAQVVSEIPADPPVAVARRLEGHHAGLSPEMLARLKEAEEEQNTIEMPGYDFSKDRKVNTARAAVSQHYAH